MRVQKVKQTRLNASDITQFLEVNSRMSFHTPYVADNKTTNEKKGQAKVTVKFGNVLMRMMQSMERRLF